MIQWICQNLKTGRLALGPLNTSEPFRRPPIPAAAREDQLLPFSSDPPVPENEHLVAEVSGSAQDVLVTEAIPTNQRDRVFGRFRPYLLGELRILFNHQNLIMLTSTRNKHHIRKPFPNVHTSWDSFWLRELLWPSDIPRLAWKWSKQQLTSRRISKHCKILEIPFLLHVFHLLRTPSIYKNLKTTIPRASSYFSLPECLSV